MPVPLTINHTSDFKKDDPFQVHIAIHGKTKEAVVEQLKDLITQVESYGKPMQGTNCCYHCTKYVSTPIWNSQEY